MNPIARMGCRACQLAFRAAMPLLPYRQPQLLDHLPDAVPLLAQRHVESVLLITGGAARRLGLTAALERALSDAGIRCTVYERHTPDPTIDDVEAARQVYLRAGAQAMIAVGGGSALDCAKAVGARMARPNRPIPKMRGLLRVLRPTPLLIAAPTTAGSGSETTLAAVITDAERHHKYPINDFALIPDFAVLDAGLTLDLPPFVTATTGLDALTHAIEAYIGRSTTRLTRAMAEEAVALIVGNLRRAYENGRDEEARRHMLRAAYCAGIAFTRSYVGYVHGVAHSLGGQYGIAHGLANAVILPKMLRRYGPACHKKLARLARVSLLAGDDTPDSEAAEALIRWIEDLNRAFSLPQAFPQIRREDIPQMARRAARECNPLYPVPVLMDARELEKIYEELMV